ncbi:undecaprenyl-phosphate glucose phosphotransferase [Pseudacidovorax intermedius]|uniref:undecaprenyl-phosphate glucose phosphotransferase n=1 Tax=Pseudacidovorax intermedius TaxID=433924 RepID=UPI0026F15998|nr:undecaprenyl-phosphate glucose phosphotransferase [Pseudacidovorax intermedius]
MHKNYPKRVPKLINNRSRVFITRISDALTVAVAGWAAIRFPLYDFRSIPENSEIFLIASIAAGLLAYIIFPAVDLYKSWRGAPFSLLLLRTSFAWFLVCGIVISSLFFLFGGAHISRRWVISWTIYALALLWIIRCVLSLVLSVARRSGYNRKQVFLVGYGSLGKLIHRRTNIFPDAGFRVSFIFNDDWADEGDSVQGAQKIDEISEISKIVKREKLDEVWLALPIAEQENLKRIMDELKNELVKIRWLPDIFALQIFGHKFEDFMGITAVHLNAPPSPGVVGVLKSLFDKIFAAIALVSLSPVLLAIALIIKSTSAGPVFFRQPRQGKGGQEFKIYKFRTMKIHGDSGGITQAKRNDARITKVGSFLRKTSLDELPQFINVLFGDMSVVGPRPHAIEHNRIYSEKIEGYMLRHLVKPGITGWAQINGWRGETDTLEKMARRVEFDIYYIRNWSFALDIRIIWLTAFKGWSGKNAY